MNNGGALAETDSRSLKKQGINVSRDGVSVKTNRRGIDREEMLDATQRSVSSFFLSSRLTRSRSGLVNALNNAQYGTPDAQKSVASHLSHRKTPSKAHMKDIRPMS